MLNLLKKKIILSCWICSIKVLALHISEAYIYQII